MPTINAQGQTVYKSGEQMPVLSGSQTPVPTTTTVPAPNITPTPNIAGSTGATLNDTQKTANQNIISQIQTSSTAPKIDSTIVGNTKPITIPVTTTPAPYTAPVINPISTQTTQTQQQTDATNVKSNLSGYLKDLMGMSDVTTQLQNEQDLSGKTQAAVDANNAYTQAKVGLQQKIANIYNQPGISRQAADQAAQEESRHGNENLANLAVISQAASGNLQAAQQIIKDKLDAQFAPAENYIKYASQYLQLNNADLTDSEKAKLQASIQSAQSDKNSVQTAASDIHDRLAQNNAPASVYSQLDTIVNNFTAGKISAQEAQNQMYQAAGQYGSKNKYSVVTNPLTGVQSAFDTTTGTFKGQDGQTYSTQDVASNPTIATQAVNSTQPVITNGVTAHPATGNIVVDTAQQLVDGNQAPSQMAKRGVQYNAILNKANELSLAQTGKPYSPIDAEAAYKFRNSGTYQKFISNAPVAMSTINTIVNDVQKLGDKLNGADIFNSAWLKATASGFNIFATQEQRATAKELVNTLGSISADDIGLLLGSGSGSDYKTKLGGAIFDVNGNVKTTEQIAKTVNDRIQAKLNDYYRIAGVKDPSIYAVRDTQAITGGTQNSSGSNIVTAPDGQQIQITD